MIIRVDGHEIPVLTEADMSNMTDEQRAQFKQPVRATVTNGHMEVTLVGDTDKATMYDVKGQFNPKATLDFAMVRPPDAGVGMDIASLRPLRVHGTQNHAVDALHQIWLFHAIGSVTVASSHVEMAMRKVLVSLRGGQNHDLSGDDIPAEWSRLHEALDTVCKTDVTDLKTKLKTLLDEAESAKLRERRNDLIHGYWWLVPMSDNELVVARYFHPKAKQPPGNSHPTPEQLQDFAGKLFAFAAKLEALVTPDWPIAIVPSLGTLQNSDVVSRTASKS